MTPSTRRRLLAGVFVAYLAVVAFGVFGPPPGPVVREAGEAARKVAAPVLGRSSKDARDGKREKPYLRRHTNEAIVNAAMFAILAALFPVVAARWRWWTIPIAVLLSATIESIQRLFLSWRTPSLGDIAWNSVGATIGFLTWFVAWAGWRWRSTRTANPAAGGCEDGDAPPTGLSTFSR